MNDAAFMMEAKGVLCPELLHALASASVISIRARARWMAHAIEEPEVKGS
ncbi:hypothetical protein [Pseudorhodoferax aquiterrae]|nr:hypothetical protein [Pseudorhodoferax aquiterrae]